MTSKIRSFLVIRGLLAALQAANNSHLARMHIGALGVNRDMVPGLILLKSSGATAGVDVLFFPSGLAPGCG